MSGTLLRRGSEAVAGIAVVLVLLYFLLASGDLFLRKLIRTLPTLEDKKRAVDIARQLESDLSAYLSTVTLINLGLGVAVGVAMYLLGLPNPVLWGGLATILNFVPYLGAIVGILVIGLVAALTFDGVGQMLLPPLVYFLLTACEGYFVTPMILGRRLTLNPVMILLSLLFWGWLWGIAGAVLAVPMLAVVKILCDHLEPLHPLGEFLAAGLASFPGCHRATSRSAGARAWSGGRRRGRVARGAAHQALHRVELGRWRAVVLVEAGGHLLGDRFVAQLFDLEDARPVALVDLDGVADCDPAVGFGVFAADADVAQVAGWVAWERVLNMRATWSHLSMRTSGVGASAGMGGSVTGSAVGGPRRGWRVEATPRVLAAWRPPRLSVALGGASCRGGQAPAATLARRCRAGGRHEPRGGVCEAAGKEGR